MTIGRHGRDVVQRILDTVDRAMKNTGNTIRFICIIAALGLAVVLVIRYLPLDELAALFSNIRGTR